jgi:DNA-binding LacI/PurR family transcriptional regulator
MPLRHDWLSVRVYRGVERRARELGFGLLMGSSSFDVGHEEELVAEHLEAGAQGVILNPVMRRGVPLEEDYLARRWRDVPIVLIDLGMEEWGRHIITFDNYRLGYEMTRELLRRGHRNILFMDVTPDTVWRSIAERARGWRTALKEAGVLIPGTYPGWPGVERVEMWIAGKEGSMDELADRLLRLDPLPDAVIAWEDQTAIMLTRALLARGVDVPGQIRLTGFDDHDTARRFTPPFPTSRPGFTRAGELAVDLIYDQLNGRALAPRTFILPVPVVWREPGTASGRERLAAAAVSSGDL